jgi:2-succinyl-5-enolpyruvyl-6-hydroxy-3-cyclohexene-1-carboxylate synthase
MSSHLFTPSPVLGEVIIDQLIRMGVKDAVIAPGSRNAPLTMALWRAAQRNEIRLHTRIDERSAAFLALGIAKATKLPTPVICTSGSAAANFYPALLEAHHSGQPLIAITADRPARLWQTGANQTTQQINMYPAAIEKSVNLAANSTEVSEIHRWRTTIATAITANKPAHINVEFEEPLVGSLEWSGPIDIDVNVPRENSTGNKAIEKYHSHGVILLGHDLAGISFASISKFSQETGWPILSENPLLGQEVIGHASLLLADEKRRAHLKPHIAMVIGRLTLSRAINAYLASADYQIVVDPQIKDVDTKRVADELHFTLPVLSGKVEPEIEWQAKFVTQSHLISAKLMTLLNSWSEPLAARTVTAQLPNNSALFVASSRPIRDIEAFADPRTGIETFSNRGLAGIDGNIATAFGIALSRERTYAILGDLAFLHDINGLLIGSDEFQPNLTIIVISNDGGGIFSTLPQNDVPGFEKIFGTPHGRDLVKVAESYGIDAIAVRTTDALIAQLARGTSGIRVIVCEMPHRSENANLLSEITASLALL